MSRIGRKPVAVPSSVDVVIGKDNHITVKGAKGQLECSLHPDMLITKSDGEVLVERPSDGVFHRGLHGLTRTLIQNMVTGVSEGFVKELEIHGVGYRAVKKGSDVEIQAGYSHPVMVKQPSGIELDVPAANKVVVSGADKQLVGEVAAKIRAIRKPEPYKGKGIRYVGEHVRRKVGKAGK